MPYSPREMKAAIIRNLQEKTGRDLDGWKALIRKQRLKDRDQIAQWLESEHDLGHIQANIVAGEFTRPAGATDPTPQELIDSQYMGPKESLRKILDSITRAVMTFGNDIEIYPTKTYVCYRRVRQFAIVKPLQGGRVDLKMALPAVRPNRRLRSSSHGSDRISHVVSLTGPADFDLEVQAWLRTAYDQDGERRRSPRKRAE